MVNGARFPLNLSEPSVARARGAAQCQCCGIWRSIGDDPVPRRDRPAPSPAPPSPPPPPGEADVSIGRPDRPSCIVAPNLPTTIREKEIAAAPPRRLNQIERVSLGASRAREGKKAWLTGPPLAARSRAGKAGRPRSCQQLDRPSSSDRPKPVITKPKSAARAGRTAARRRRRRARFRGHHPPRDKDQQISSRKCRSEQTPQSHRCRAV